MSEAPSDQIVEFVRDHYQSRDFIPLHAPVFTGREKDYVADTIDSTFVSSVGKYVDRFEQDIARYTRSPAAVATVNGTAALHVALRLSGVRAGDLVITQPLTFVATCNAIHYCGAAPVFTDIDRHTLGLSANAMESWLEEHAFLDDDACCRHRQTGKAIRACVPMHTFGHPADLDTLARVCQQWHLTLVEDAAESLGSFYKGRHTGTVGTLAALSFNGNKIITTGGGGMILTSTQLAGKAKHLTTTAKQPHPYEYIHDEVGYNYRLPNLNAALGVAQLEQLTAYLLEKRQLAEKYAELFRHSELEFVTEPEGCTSNYWLNAVICPDKSARDALLKETNEHGIMTRPAWHLMSDLDLYRHSLQGALPVARAMAETLVNLPSSIRQAHS